MRANFIFASSLLLTGCASYTTSSNEEAVLFSSKEASTSTANAQAVLKPYRDLPLSIEFACPKKATTVATFYMIPLPPVIPVGFMNDKVSYLHIRMPEGTENAIDHTRIVTAQGTAIPLSDVRQSKSAVTDDGTVEATYAVDKECEALNGGVLQVAGFSYRDKRYPASEAQLQFDSRLSGRIGWWPPMLFNGGQPLHDAGKASGTSAQ